MLSSFRVEFGARGETFDFRPLTLDQVIIDSKKVNVVIKLLNHNVHTPHQGERVGFELIFPSTTDGTEENLIIIEGR